VSNFIVADTSVLLNFLKIDRMDLIGRFPLRFLVTDHVATEVTNPQHQACYAAAIAAGHLDTCSVTDIAEVKTFARLTREGRLGSGERAAIAVALRRRYPLAIDDNKAVGRALREAGMAGARLTVLRTADVMVSLIRAGVIQIAEADTIRVDWERNHRFQIKAASFRDLL
jgi:predicted nucleic acid-binding protein